MRTAVIVLAILALIAAGIWYEVALWGECLESHPWWYCLRVVVR